MPGLTGATGGETRDSEAAILLIPHAGKAVSLKTQFLLPAKSDTIQMPFVDAVDATLGAWEATGVSSPPLESALIVEVEDERPNVLVKGAKCVSLSSIQDGD